MIQRKRRILLWKVFYVCGVVLRRSFCFEHNENYVLHDDLLFVNSHNGHLGARVPKSLLNGIEFTSGASKYSSSLSFSEKKILPYRERYFEHHKTFSHRIDYPVKDFPSEISDVDGESSGYMDGAEHLDVESDAEPEHMFSSTWESSHITSAIDITSKKEIDFSDPFISHIDTIIHMLNIPKYFGHLKYSSLEDISNLLWTYSLLVISPRALVPEKYQKRSKIHRAITKRECFKENLLSLLLQDKGVSEQIYSIIRYLDKNSSYEKNLYNAPTEQLSAHSRIEWIFSLKELNNLRWFLYCSLSTGIRDIKIQGTATGNTNQKSIMYLSFFSPSNKCTNCLYVPELFLEQKYPEKLKITIENHLSIPEEAIISLLDVFPSVQMVIFLSLGNEDKIENNEHLLSAILKKDQVRRKFNLPQSITGIQINYLFALSHSSIAMLMNTDLVFFGFSSFYQRYAKKEMTEWHVNEHAVLFLKDLLKGRFSLSESLRILSCPVDAFSLSSLEYPILPRLDTLELQIHSTSQLKGNIEKKMDSFSQAFSSLRKLHIVEIEPLSSSSLSIYAFALFKSLSSIDTLDLSRTTIPLDFLHTYLKERYISYSSSLSHILLPYIVPQNASSQKLISEMHRRFPALSQLIIVLPEEKTYAFLPSLIHDVALTLSTLHIDPQRFSSIVSVYAMKRLSFSVTNDYIISPLSIPFSQIKPMYASIRSSLSNTPPTAEEVFLSIFTN
ncbi:hypothetical protein NEFER03_1761 [Nematocida sp. LUAm3]|nr:hypothetical protein NEFER03_1761 [Nematocida sp. LUAm3]